VDYAVDHLGLREAERSDGVSYLTHGSAHHSLQYIEDDEASFDHMAFEVADARALAALRTELEPAGVEFLDEPVEAGVEDAFRFVGPGGHVFEIYHGMQDDQPSFHATAPAPKLFGHVTVKCENTDEMREFAERHLGFKTSDVIETPGGGFVFMRCNARHHALAVAPGTDQFHHYAWELQNLATLGELADRLGRERMLLWGPGRHGPGHNLFTYHFDPAGAIVEHYADMDLIDSDNHEVGIWPDAPATMNQWGPLPNEDFVGKGLKITDRGRRRGDTAT
jgi:catechol 2,3-dioxygenase-like lactoylglutathione lyase family enzyme